MTPPDPWNRLIPSVVQVITDMTNAASRPWLILGKGPSANHRHLWNLDAFHVITLNHAALVHTQAAIHHFVDWEALDDCRTGMRQDALIAMPWRPHRNHMRTGRNLGDHLRDLTTTRKFRFCSYNVQNSERPRPDLPRLMLRRFSAVAVFAMLGAANQSPIYSLGVDGGVGYAGDFDLKDHLANGRTTFDDQMPYIRQLLKKHGTLWYRLGDDTTGQHSRFAKPTKEPAHDG